MCDAGCTRTITFYEVCEDGVGARECKQDQTCERVWWKLWLGRSWVNKGLKRCGECPNGPKDPESVVVLGCFAGCYVLLPGTLTGPGIVGVIGDLLGSWVPGTPPTSWVMQPLGQFVPINKKVCKFLVENLTKVIEQLKASGRINEAQTHQKALDSLKQKCKEFGWS